MGDKIGYGYEVVCQRALWEGIQYLAKTDEPEKILEKTASFKNVYGICETPESAKELEQIWSKLDREVFKGWTGAQHQAVVGHLQFISKNGVKKWLDEFKDTPDRYYEIDLSKLMSLTTCHDISMKQLTLRRNG
jgi:2'-5' RNA ligase